MPTDTGWGNDGETRSGSLHNKVYIKFCHKLRKRKSFSFCLAKEWFLQYIIKAPGLHFNFSVFFVSLLHKMRRGETMGNRLRKVTPFYSCKAGFGYGALLLIFFVLGVLCGSFLCDRMDTAEELALYLSAFLTCGEEMRHVSLWAATWLYFRHPLMTFGLSLVPVGLFLMPFFFLFLGTELSFSVAAFLSVLGRKGLWAALCTLGIRAAVVLPCCFVIACCVFSGRREKAALQENILRFLFLAGILLAGISLEVFLVPWLLPRALAGMNF